VHVKNIFRFTLIPVGIALLLAALFFDMGTAGSSHPQVRALSTPDRLAEPTLPASPSQADRGAQVYWLSCMPCHGDRGQGLTDEFRQTYPVEDRNCWNSGCHGKRPYDQGFTIPTKIAAVIGPGTLQKFPTAGNLRGYVFAAMPYWRPGSLTEEQSWQVTAFILRQNGLKNLPDEINASNADRILVGAPAAPSPTPGPGGAGSPLEGVGLVLGGAVLLVLLVLVSRRRSGS
jgi:mono/diheme cytochrome c family protein